MASMVRRIATLRSFIRQRGGMWFYVILDNPVRAGLVERPEDWPWSDLMDPDWFAGGLGPLP